MPKRRDNKTKRRPREDKQDKNKEEWKRKYYNHVHFSFADTLEDNSLMSSTRVVNVRVYLSCRNKLGSPISVSTI